MQLEVHLEEHCEILEIKFRTGCFMNKKVDVQLVKLIEDAARKAIKLLFSQRKENFYYCSLITDGEGHCPLISAWSEEALQQMLQKEHKISKEELKWSYADSPYYAFGEEFFENVREVYNSRSFNVYSDSFQEEFELRINSMEKAMENLDKEGLFGKGNERLQIVINAEVMPPDYGNTERALRLNPKEALKEWLEEIAEEQ